MEPNGSSERNIPPRFGTNPFLGKLGIISFHLLLSRSSHQLPSLSFSHPSPSLSPILILPRWRLPLVPSSTYLVGPLPPEPLLVQILVPATDGGGRRRGQRWSDVKARTGRRGTWRGEESGDGPEQQGRPATWIYRGEQQAGDLDLTSTPSPRAASSTSNAHSHASFSPSNRLSVMVADMCMIWPLFIHLCKPIHPLHAQLGLSQATFRASEFDNQHLP